MKKKNYERSFYFRPPNIGDPLNEIFRRAEQEVAGKQSEERHGGGGLT